MITKKREDKFMELFLSGRYRALIVRLTGELDDRAAAKIRESVDRELIRTGAVNVAFDMSGVTFMDSAGLGVIMGRAKITESLGGSVIVYGARDNVQRLLTMSGLGGIVTIADTLEEGMGEVSVRV